MTWKPTVIVLVVALVGVVAAAGVWRSERVASGRPAGGSGSLFASDELPIERIARITLVRRGQPRLVFERIDEAWQQTEPFAYPVDPYSIRQLAVLAAQLDPVKRLGPDEQPGDLGFEPPMAVVGFEWPQGAATLQFGRRGAAGRWYVRRLGETDVSVVTGELHDRAVEMDPKEWRDRKLFDAVGPSADRIEIVDGDLRTVLVRDRRQWVMSEPVVTRLDAAARDDLFAALGRAEAGGFILDQPDDLATFGLDQPAGSITVTSTRLDTGPDGEVSRTPVVEQLLVGAPAGVGSQDRFGQMTGRPVVVRLPESVLRAFFRRAETLVDPTASGVIPADVKTIVIDGPGGVVRLHRDLDEWRDAASDKARSTKAVEELLALLAVRRAEEVRLEPYPRDLQVATVSLFGFNNQPLDTVRIAREAGEGAWALENGDDVLRVVGAKTQVPLTPADFRPE